MPRVQGCLLHTTSLPYIYTKFPRRDPSRGNRLYFCMELSFPDRRNRWVICSKRHKYKTIFSFRASFFGSGIKKSPRIAPRAVAVVPVTAVCNQKDMRGLYRLSAARLILSARSQRPPLNWASSSSVNPPLPPFPSMPLNLL